MVGKSKSISLSAPAEACSDNGHRHVVTHALVHQSTEDDVGVRVHVRVDHFSRRVDLTRGHTFPSREWNNDRVGLDDKRLE